MNNFLHNAIERFVIAIKPQNSNKKRGVEIELKKIEKEK